jgi:hypothetical protein
MCRNSKEQRRYRAGDSVDDRCRPCKLLRKHSVLVTSPDGTPLRVICDYCGSQHNYRGGEATASRSVSPTASRSQQPAFSSPGPFPLVDERERSHEPMSVDGSAEDLELLLRRVIREESGLTPVVPADKWRGGELVLRPGREGVQEKSWPIETFFSKVVMVRNRLRTLEQQVNASELPAETKVKLQGYVTGCYGSLTSQNVLFADEEDRFKGAG